MRLMPFRGHNLKSKSYFFNNFKQRILLLPIHKRHNEKNKKYIEPNSHSDRQGSLKNRFIGFRIKVLLVIQQQN